MSNNLIVNDEFVSEKASSICQNFTELDSFVQNYIKILKEASADGIQNGSTAEALQAFIQIASSLSGSLERIGKEVSSELKSYLPEIDSADEYLF